MGSHENYFGFVGQQNKGNNTKFQGQHIDHGVKETCVIMSTKVTYEIDHISLLRFNSIKCTKFLFFMYFIVISKKKVKLQEIQ